MQTYEKFAHQERGGCWIFRIQGEDLTRRGEIQGGGGVRPPSW